ncbi:nuclear RNA export factor 1-like [Panulirus ornatus]|uniref:nuclear RNA export factor 1-like n=1 Tax=Panulirus ornatus TaxID=150431 RepID=UPI003A87EF3D
MGGRGNRFPPKNVYITAKATGSRQYYEHDDRGSSRSGGGSDGGGGRGSYRTGYRDGGKFRGGRNWESGWDNDRSSRLPEGHWRGDNRRGAGRGFRSPRVPRYQDETDSLGIKDRNWRQDMYKARGGRRGRDYKYNRSYQNNPTNTLGWHKILIRDGNTLDKHQVLSEIRSLVQEPFTPFLFETEGKNLVFYLEDNGPAVHAIIEINRRITMPNGQRLQIWSNRSPPPNRPLPASQAERVTQVMSDRYSVELKRLDLKNFHNDATLMKEGIFCPLYRQPNMQIIVDIIVSNIPQVEEIDLSYNKIHGLDELERIVSSCPNLQRLNLGKNKIQNEAALEKLSGLGIIDLTLEGNPLCDKFRDTETYISAVRKHFTKVIYLDGQELPKPIGFEVDEEITKLPQSCPSYFAIPDVKGLVLQFIEQYYQIFDTENRRPLEAAYSVNALFSLVCNFPETGPGARYTNIYLTTNRNLKKVTSTDRRQKLVYQGRKNIGTFLCQLPYTMHDPLSFTVDVPLTDNKLMVVTLSGVFRQLTDRNPPIRSFTRTLTIIPEGTGYCICNEQMHLTTATVDQVKKAFKTPVANIPQSNQQIQTAVENVPVVAQGVLQPVQEAMIAKFSEISGMLPQYSQLCLEENGWDYNKAGEIFTQLKAENKIPPEYFPQNPA